jgi:two-component system, OmpR family, phosphate regulon sensor histidine kinase PhoR
VADQAFAFHVADLAQVGLLRVDHFRVIRESNDTARQLLGPQVRELVGRTVLETFLDHRVIEMLDQALVAGTAQREITFGTDPPRTFLLHALRNPAGAWIVIRDVSELRRLQRIRTEFVDNLAHELRAPLTNVRLLAETLAMDADAAQLSPRVRDSISRIEAETDHLAAMVSELLDLARIEQGEVPMQREPVDLAGLAASVASRLQPFADRQAVRIVTQLPPTAGERTVIGDAERLEQLLFNLVHNAIKFSPADTEVIVRLASAHDQASVVVEVEDHGPGIPKRDLDRIFERFYKVDRARTRGGQGGTGLGLAIARHIAEAHDGRVWVQSTEGDGATFFVSLPRA